MILFLRGEEDKNGQLDNLIKFLTENDDMHKNNNTMHE